MTDISDFKLECAKMFLMKLSQHDSNFGQNFLAVLEYASGRVTKIPPLFPPLSKYEVLRVIGHEHRKSNFGFQ